jgi:leader peptidase (prepilin peptidase) / N-methyltransferase
VALRLLLDAYAAVLGLIAGSYLNVVIHRLPRGLSTVAPRSACPACGAPIAARDNLPLLSFALLGGRCRACQAPIPWRYPLVEALTALLFVGCLERFGFSQMGPVGPAATTATAATMATAALATLAAALFCCLMVALGLIDLEHLLLPDRLTLPGIAAGLALQTWLPWGGLRQALAGALLGAAVLLAIWGGWYLVRHEEGMGLGDVKMLALIGAFLGWKGTLVALFFASFTGALTGLALIWRGGAGMRSKLPFGSFLALGGLTALFAGRELAAWYAGLL